MKSSDGLDRTELAMTLMRIARSAIRSGGPRDLGLSGLAVLARLKREGPRRVTELAALEGLSQPAVTALVNKLAPRGLLARTADPGDGRAVLVGLTADGERMLDDRDAERARILGGVIDTLPAEDVEALRVALPALGRLAVGYEQATASQQGAPRSRAAGSAA